MLIPLLDPLLILLSLKRFLGFFAMLFISVSGLLNFGLQVWDVTAADPKLLVYLKSYRNTVPVPRHWCQKRKFLQVNLYFSYSYE
jgi:Domain of unknown function (DUF382)